MIRFNCSACGASISAPPEAAGKRGKCLKCGATNVVPIASGETEPQALRTVPLPPARPEVLPAEREMPQPTIVQVTTPPAQVRQQVYVEATPTNGLGTAGFVCSLIGVLTCGLLSPIGLLFSLVAMFKAPRGMAIAGAFLGTLGSLWVAFFGFAFLMTLAGLGAAVEEAQREQERVAAESVQKRFPPDAPELPLEFPTFGPPAESRPSVAAESEIVEVVDEPTPTPTEAEAPKFTPADVPVEEIKLTKFRYWHDAKGRAIQAKFVSYANDTVTLRTEKGREFDVPYDKLSAGDQQFLIDNNAFKYGPEDAAP